MVTFGPSPDFDMVPVEWGPFIYLDGTAPTGNLAVSYSGGEMVDPATAPARSVRIGTGSSMNIPLTTLSLQVNGQPKDFAFASFMVPGSNDPDILGGGGTYTVTPSLSKGGSAPVTFFADINAGTIRLNDVTPTPSTPGDPITVVTYAAFTTLQARVTTLESRGGGVASPTITAIQQVTSAQYAALTPNPTTLYVVTD